MASTDKVKGEIDTVRGEALQSGAYPHAFADEGETDPNPVEGAEFDDSEPTRADQPIFSSSDDTRGNDLDEPSADDGEPTRAG